MYIHTDTYTHLHMYIYIAILRLSIHIYIYTCVYIDTQLYMCICTHVSLYIYTRIVISYMYMRYLVVVCISMCVYIYICIYVKRYVGYIWITTYNSGYVSGSSQLKASRPYNMWRCVVRWLSSQRFRDPPEQCQAPPKHRRRISRSFAASSGVVGLCRVGEAARRSR